MHAGLARNIRSCTYRRNKTHDFIERIIYLEFLTQQLCRSPTCNYKNFFVKKKTCLILKCIMNSYYIALLLK